MAAPDVHHRLHEDVQALLTGTLFVALGVYLFSQAQLLTGGTPGVAFLVHYATGWDLPWVLLAVNTPFYVLAWRRKGPAFTLKTMVAVGLLAGFLALLPGWMAFSKISPTLATVLGGLLIGVGLLILFRHRASLGGFNVLALVVQDHTGWPAGRVQMVLDGTVMLAALTLLPWQQVLLSTLGGYVLNQILATNHRPDRYVAL